MPASIGTATFFASPAQRHSVTIVNQDHNYSQFNSTESFFHNSRNSTLFPSQHQFINSTSQETLPAVEMGTFINVMPPLPGDFERILKQ